MGLIKVVFDSSFLMAVVEHPTTWFEDITEALGKFQPVLPDCISEELQRLAALQGRKARSAKLALEMAGSFAKSRCSEHSPDQELLKLSQDPGVLVATLDAEILRELRRSPRKAVTLRKGRMAVA